MKCIHLLLPILFIATPAIADISDAGNACIDALMSSGKATAPGGEVLSDEFSEAGSLVMLKDGGGQVWKCIAYKDGSIGELSMVDGGSSVQNSAPNVSGERRVEFDAGASGTVMSATLAPGAVVSYVLGAKNGQFLNVDVNSYGGALDYQIFNPDGSRLLDLISSDTPYQGQLWQSGDHVIDVVNSGAQPVTFDIGIGIN